MNLMEASHAHLFVTHFLANVVDGHGPGLITYSFAHCKLNTKKVKLIRF